MRHVILGAGAIGGLIGAALARAGGDVSLLMRPESLATYPGRLVVESVVLGDFEVELAARTELDGDLDVLWVAVKATSLDSAVRLAPPEQVGNATVIPLMNGVDHLARLRERYADVVAGAIWVESERAGPARLVQRSPVLRMAIAGADAVVTELKSAGIDASVHDDESTLIWSKLSFLAPLALATTAFDAPLGAVRDDERFLGCVDETLAVAGALGAALDEAAVRRAHLNAPAEMRSSMQKDVAAGRAPELDAIAGPILRGGASHDIPVPNTEQLAGLVAARASAMG